MGNAVSYKKNKTTVRKNRYVTEVKKTYLEVSPGEVVYQWNTKTTVDPVMVDKIDDSDPVVESSDESSVRV
jgi:hypothetical protein